MSHTLLKIKNLITFLIIKAGLNPDLPQFISGHVALHFPRYIIKLRIP